MKSICKLSLLTFLSLPLFGQCGAGMHQVGIGAGKFYCVLNDGAAWTLTNLGGTPANPTSGKVKVYPKGGAWCSLSSVGVETCTGGSGTGGSAFAGSTATTQSFSATPTIDCGNVSNKSPVIIAPAAMTANVTAVTFANCGDGARFAIPWLQDGTGGRTVTYGGSTVNTCLISGTANITTLQKLYVIGGVVKGEGCDTDEATPNADTVNMGKGSSANPAYVAVNNCSTALTYNTSTHAWGCNAGAGGATGPTGPTGSTGSQGVTGATGGSTPGVGRSSLAATWTAIADGDVQEQTATWTGVLTSDTVILGPPSGLAAGLIATARVSASDTVAIRILNLSGGSVTPGAQTFSGTLAIYNLAGSGTLDFGSIPDGGVLALTFALTGTTAGDPVAAKWPSSLETGLVGTMRASATDTVEVRLTNFSGAAVNPASQSFGASIAK